MLPADKACLTTAKGTGRSASLPPAKRENLIMPERPPQRGSVKWKEVWRPREDLWEATVSFGVEDMHEKMMGSWKDEKKREINDPSKPVPLVVYVHTKDEVDQVGHAQEFYAGAGDKCVFTAVKLATKQDKEEVQEVAGSSTCWQFKIERVLGRAMMAGNVRNPNNDVVVRKFARDAPGFQGKIKALTRDQNPEEIDTLWIETDSRYWRGEKTANATYQKFASGKRGVCQEVARNWLRQMLPADKYTKIIDTFAWQHNAIDRNATEWTSTGKMKFCKKIIGDLWCLSGARDDAGAVFFLTPMHWENQTGMKRPDRDRAPRGGLSWYEYLYVEYARIGNLGLSMMMGGVAQRWAQNSDSNKDRRVRWIVSGVPRSWQWNNLEDALTEADFTELRKVSATAYGAEATWTVMAKPPADMHEFMQLQTKQGQMMWVTPPDRGNSGLRTYGMKVTPSSNKKNFRIDNEKNEPKPARTERQQPDLVSKIIRAEIESEKQAAAQALKPPEEQRKTSDGDTEMVDASRGESGDAAMQNNETAETKIDGEGRPHKAPKRRSTDTASGAASAAEAAAQAAVKYELPSFLVGTEQQTKGGGACLFDAFSNAYCIARAREKKPGEPANWLNHTGARIGCITYMDKNWERYDTLWDKGKPQKIFEKLDGKFRDYLTQLRSRTAWGGYLELHALARFYAVNVWVFVTEQEKPWLFRGANKKNDQGKDRIIFLKLHDSHYTYFAPSKGAAATASLESVRGDTAGGRGGMEGTVGCVVGAEPAPPPFPGPVEVRGEVPEPGPDEPKTVMEPQQAGVQKNCEPPDVPGNARLSEYKGIYDRVRAFSTITPIEEYDEGKIVNAVVVVDRVMIDARPEKRTKYAVNGGHDLGGGRTTVYTDWQGETGASKAMWGASRAWCRKCKDEKEAWELLGVRCSVCKVTGMLKRPRRRCGAGGGRGWNGPAMVPVVVDMDEAIYKRDVEPFDDGEGGVRLALTVWGAVARSTATLYDEDVKAVVLRVAGCSAAALVTRETRSVAAEPAKTHLAAYAGVGGFERAAKAVGFRTTAAVDIDEELDAVRSSAQQRTHADMDEVREWTRIARCMEAERRKAGRRDWGHILFTAGFPCPPWSKAKVLMVGLEDPRAWHFKNVVRMIVWAQPAVFVLETGPQFLTYKDGVVYAILREMLREEGYLCRAQVTDAAGLAPQTRKRAYIVGWRGDVWDAACEGGGEVVQHILQRIPAMIAPALNMKSVVEDWTHRTTRGPRRGPRAQI